MFTSDVIHSINQKYNSMQSVLHERGIRRWAASEAQQLGRGGVSIISLVTGMSRNTIRRGLLELKSINDEQLDISRSRRSGGGRKKIEQKYPNIKNELDKLIDPMMRGDPQSPLRWTCKSIRCLSRELKQKNINASPNTILELLYEMEYSLQANRKTREGVNHPDRNKQFLYINKKVKSFLKSNQPAISVDTKKKENIGNYSMKGVEYRPKKHPIETNIHDFPNTQLGKAIPYGIYDIGRNEGWVSIGIDHDTAAFAVNSIRTWWNKMGRKNFPDATKLLITADAGGSNGYRTNLWKFELQKFADECGLDITVCHFPPGTSKWNKIEHRLFSFITKNWRGQPLINMATVVNLISNTKTKQGLTVHCVIDKNKYETGIKINNDELKKINIKSHKFHLTWNYTIKKSK
ncbi:MAG: ISAzo13 family transposase [Planctomycetaceae bacterium]|nr:ISAzo13 family transposase [Planctomycetaceae bacterium]